MAKKHKHTSKPSRIWSFGASEPTENLELVMGQLRLAHQYRNTLCALERQRRAEFHATVDCLCPTLAAIDKAYGDAVAKRKACEVEAKTRNSEARKRRATPEERATIKQLKVEEQMAKKKLADAKRDLFSSGEMIDAQECLNFAHQARTQLARKEYVGAGLHWGTYLKIEDACKGFSKGRPPRFLKFSGEGKIAVQLQGNKKKPHATVASILNGTDSRLQITLGKTRADGATLATVRLRIGTVKGTQDPIWTTFPVVFHSQERRQCGNCRPLPLDARVTWAWLIRRQEKGTHYRWDFQIVLAQDSWHDSRRNHATGKVGIDVGWRWLGEEWASGIRVCAWVGSDDKRGELVIPFDEVKRWKQVQSLRSRRDILFNEARDWLMNWLKGREVPQWLTEETASISRWKSPNRLAKLILHWRDNRFPGDDQAMAALEGERVQIGFRPSLSGPKPKYRYTGWRKQDRHLYDWERAVEEKACRWRDDLFRNFVRKLSSKYAVVHLEQKFIAKVAKRKAVDDESEEMAQAARRNRVIASPGRLAALAKEVFGVSSTVGVPPAYTSLRCHYCKKLKAFPNPKGLIRTCRYCHKTDDRDWCGATNLRDASADVVNKTPAPARDPQPDGRQDDTQLPSVA